jgi:tetratricopeptide (TPR) repeat protein
MKSTSKLIIFAFAFLALDVIAYAQSPREQMQQLTTQLQQTPNDNALRERIIKLGAELKPAPAVPEEARRSFVEGVNIVKLAKDVSSQNLAIGSFTEALKIAPWWGDAYYNLAVAQELTGQLNDAERTLKWFLLSNPGEGEAREAQDRIYGLSAKRKLAAAEAGAKQEQADREMAAQAQRFVGDWFRDVRGEDGSEGRYTLTIRRDADGPWRVHIFLKSGSHVSESRVHDIRVVGTELRFEHDHLYGSEISATYEVSTSLSVNGNTLRLAYTPMPLTARQEAYAKNFRSWPSPFVDEYTKH